MLRNLASSLILTERDAELDDNTPKVKGRVTTTLHKAKEVRPLVERCITIARRSLKDQENADQFATTAERGSAEWKQWRTSDDWQKWCNAISPTVAARRRCVQLLGDKEAVQLLFDEIAPRFADRDGGYTRILRVAQRRLGDAGVQAIIEFVGVRDRETARSEKPSFGDETEEAKDQTEEEAVASEEEVTSDASETAEAAADESNAEKED